jgi:hypothetical protein
MTASRSACTRLGGRCAPKHERSLGFPGWLTDLLLTSSSSVWHNSLRRPSPSAHEKRPEEERGAGIRLGWHGRLGGTARTTTRDSRRGAATAATGLPGFPGCFLFWGRLREARCRCCWAAGPAPVCWRIRGGARETAAGRTPQLKPRRAGTPRTAQKDGEARRRTFPRPPGRAARRRSPRHRAPRKPTRGPPPPRLPGATDGNHL